MHACIWNIYMHMLDTFWRVVPSEYESSTNSVGTCMLMVYHMVSSASPHAGVFKLLKTYVFCDKYKCVYLCAPTLGAQALALHIPLRLFSTCWYCRTLTVFNFYLWLSFMLRAFCVCFTFCSHMRMKLNLIWVLLCILWSYFGLLLFFIYSLFVLASRRVQRIFKWTLITGKFQKKSK